MPKHLRKLNNEDLEREKLISEVAKNESEAFKNIRFGLFFAMAKNLIFPCYTLLAVILLLPSIAKIFK